ncbi:putative ABC transport system ATP-binding protein [Desulfonatronum thiosulfatophilum]|uniref:Putative ABC transport system ATP-binding protein n=1 Tax=Desulfonatronum thiosulfatophilum TaxID=617002 RepID=A0A1G6C1C3_9BACT|nr:ABC transporter ATP-binding protein [Desulfonatronum thiosulfatophilum]SDB26683.1 putative ABC transport system ATP-binding protein [Desulfonatronum thiosulfatophilum]
MDNIILRTMDVFKTYGRGDAATMALRGITLDIPRGSFTCVVGPSGHGKSTLLHLLGGLDRPSSGRILLDGVDIGALSSSELARLRGRKIGFVFQFFNLLQGLTAIENVETAMMLAGTPERDQTERAMHLLQSLGLGDKTDSRPSDLSGGQQQRVAIARALANDPDILMMDEPTGNLDSSAEAEVMSILHSLHDQGKTIVIVSHNNEIAMASERIIRVKDGMIDSSVQRETLRTAQ